MEMNNFDPEDPNRHLKRLDKIIGVSAKIFNLTLQRRKTVHIESREERREKILASFKNNLI